MQRIHISYIFPSYLFWSQEYDLRIWGLLASRQQQMKQYNYKRFMMKVFSIDVTWVLSTIVLLSQ